MRIHENTLAYWNTGLLNSGGAGWWLLTCCLYTENLVFSELLHICSDEGKVLAYGLWLH